MSQLLDAGELDWNELLLQPAAAGSQKWKAVQMMLNLEGVKWQAVQRTEESPGGCDSCWEFNECKGGAGGGGAWVGGAGDGSSCSSCCCG